MNSPLEMSRSTPDNATISTPRSVRSVFVTPRRLMCGVAEVSCPLIFVARTDKPFLRYSHKRQQSEWRPCGTSNFKGRRYREELVDLVRDDLLHIDIFHQSDSCLG